MGVYDMSQYSIKIVDSAVSATSEDGVPTYALGQKLTVEWTAPLNHGSKDWIGIYKTSSNNSTNVTTVASKNRYLYVGKDLGLGEALEGVENHAGMGDGEVIEEEVVWIDNKEICKGRVVFLGDKLPWFQGTFEFRYHHHGRYNVMAHTAPFKLALPNHQEEAEHAVSSISRALLPYVQRCFNSDEETMPCTVDERFIMINEQIAERIVKGIQLMYGIEFAWEEIQVRHKTPDADVPAGTPDVAAVAADHAHVPAAAADAEHWQPQRQRRQEYT
ncbi:phosphatidylethanolamine N-methyltransferase, partial [Linnemannia gamsii]